MKRHIFLLQHTTTPYRTELFNMIEEESKSSNIEFTFFYYKKMAGDRNWVFDPKTMTHKFEILNSFEYFIKKYPLYFSFKLMKKIFQNPNAELILGISWNDFNIFIIVLLKRLGIVKNKLHFWTEANYMAGRMKKKSKIKDIIRNFIFNSGDGKLIIPGRVAEITVREHWNLNKEIIYLPNTVDVNFEKIEAKKFSPDKINILIVARLEENIKGILNFIQNIESTDLDQCEIVIAGEGKDRGLYEHYFSEHSLENIHLLGNINRDELLSYYKGCDLFVLPSYSDPNPLSVIETLFASKPLLISDQCGNKFEAIKEGVNGYLMNPYDGDEIKNKFHLLLQRLNEFDEMGKQSYTIAGKNFEPRSIVKSFLSNL